MAAKPVGNRRGALGSRPRRQCGFELLVHGSGPGDQTTGARSRAPPVERLVGGRHHRRMYRQAQIVVGGERHDLASVLGEHALGPTGVEGDGTAPAAFGFQTVGAGVDERRPQTGRLQRRLDAHGASPVVTLRRNPTVRLLPPGSCSASPAGESSLCRRVGPAPGDCQSWELPRSTTPRRRRSMSWGSTPPRWNTAAARASTSQASPPGTRLASS